MFRSRSCSRQLPNVSVGARQSRYNTEMSNDDCVEFLQWALPHLGFRWPGYRKVRRQVCKRITRRIDELRISGFAAYREYLETEAREWDVLDSFCRISISRFYRDRQVFDFLRDSIFPKMVEATKADSESEIRCWSAGCASGEEPYTLKLIWNLCHRVNYPDLLFSITATDAAPHMLARAYEAVYPASSLKDLPREWIQQAFDRTSSVDEAEFCLRSEFRSGIQWMCEDLRKSTPEPTFNIIVCRYLAFTYFDKALQQDVLERFIERLKPGGFLVIGKQETIETGKSSLQSVGPNIGVYEKRG